MSPLLAVAVVTVLAALALIAHQWPVHTGQHRWGKR
jgi:nitrogen fixation-related uncharacterized protein